MSSYSAQLREEQQAVSRAYDRLDALRAQARSRLDTVRAAGSHGSPTQRTERDSFATMYEDRLTQLRAVEDRLVFGRLDDVHGAHRYIGRIGLSDEDHEPILTDWRADAARPFYEATPSNPGDIVMRRHITLSFREVVGVEDEVLDVHSDQVGEASSNGTLTGEGALLASLNAKRTGKMTDIVATIQGEQDRIIRADLNQAVVVQGGPGTGKTAVALHRAAYLLYTHRRALQRSGVLVVGPSSTFLHYIDQVLPSLGETGVVSRTIADLIPGIIATAHDDPHAAKLKGERRMAKAIANAVAARERVPSHLPVIRINGFNVPMVRADIEQAIADAKAGIAGAKSDYDSTFSVKAKELTKTVSGILDSLDGISGDLDSAVDGLTDASGSLAKGLSKAAKLVNKASDQLGEASDKISAFKDELDGALMSDDLATIKTMIGNDPEGLAVSLSGPVALDRKPVYPIRNYGSAMAPFYTILSIWVGAIILCAMLKVTISDREKAHVLGLGDTLPRIAGPSGPGNASRWGLRLDHEYFGRYAIFALLALLQGTLVCLGDMYFLGVQANHALQFLAVGWLAALVFSNIVYTLTVSFGDIGKAVAVVLLVMQVAGSGGTFPIETLPKFFQMLSPFLPFPHAIDAMHAAMAGSYGNEYLLDMVYLALFLIPSLLLGLVLRKPVIRLNNWVSRNLESTKVM